MERSAGVRDAVLRFYDRFSAGDIEGFGRLISRAGDALVIGTDPQQWGDGRAAWISGFEATSRAWKGIRFDSTDLRSYEEGSMGWAADRPTVVAPDESILKTRLTAVLHREDGEWRLVNVHLSVGVPDEEVIDLQQRWSPRG
jgi:ketosteroid isomerase-like protein